MAQVFYPAIIEREGDAFGVYFPDLPGCVSAGASADEAARNAEEALAGHLLISAEDGDYLPNPSAIDQIEQDPEVNEVARILVSAILPGKAKRIQITMNEGLLGAIDKVSTNRSGFLAQAAQNELQRQREIV